MCEVTNEVGRIRRYWVYRQQREMFTRSVLELSIMRMLSRF